MSENGIYRFECRYDGSDYYGWQRQPDVETIQQQLEQVWSEVLSQPITVHGAGRTDRGVHALGQVAHLEVDPEAVPVPESRWSLLVNQRLPADISIRNLTRARRGFHSRHSATYRFYGYRFCYHTRSRFSDHQYAWIIKGNRWDPAGARGVVRELDGTIPTRVFSGRGGSTHDAEQWELDLRFRQLRPGEPWILLGSPSFRYRMVRCVATAVARVLKGRWDRTDLRSRIRKSGGALDAGPPQGCYLVRVVYYGDTPSFSEVWTRILGAFGSG